ncbi:MAG: hypothetical protein AB1831_04020 [Pseudomonadota bacterium]
MSTKIYPIPLWGRAGERAPGKAWPGLAALCALAIWAAPAQATDPLAFKGQTIGAPITAIALDPRFECRRVSTPTADQVCTLRPKEQETIAGVAVTSLYYFYDRARLTGIVIGLPEKDFQAVAQALEAKYGPAQASQEQIRNLKGERFENRTLTWRQGPAKLQAQRYAGQLDRSLIRLSDEAAAERIRQRRAQGPGQDL